MFLGDYHGMGVLAAWSTKPLVQVGGHEMAVLKNCGFQAKPTRVGRSSHRSNLIATFWNWSFPGSASVGFFPTKRHLVRPTALLRCAQVCHGRNQRSTSSRLTFVVVQSFAKSRMLVLLKPSSPIHNWQEVHLKIMAKKAALPSTAVQRPYKTTGLHLPADLWELLNRVAFERAKARGGRASVSALLVDMIEEHRKALELELRKTVR